MTQVTIHKSPPRNSILTCLSSAFCLLVEEFHISKTALKDNITSSFFGGGWLEGKICLTTNHVVRQINCR